MNSGQKKPIGLKVFLATSFGMGTWPGPGGTWGTLPPFFLHLAMVAAEVSWSVQLIVFSVIFFLSMVTAPSLVGAACKHFDLTDPRQVTLDEVAGYALGACLLINHSWSAVGTLFLLFRLWDILKPWPISRLERIKGVWGVMLDDLGAGLLAGAMVFALQWWKVMP